MSISNQRIGLIAGRRTQGVTLFRVAAEEKVVSAASIMLEEESDEIGGEQ